MFSKTLFSLIVLLSTPTLAADLHKSSIGDLKVETVADGFEHPWGMAMLPSGNLLITERGGKLWHLNPKTGKRTKIAGLPRIAAGGQAGLLDVVLDPDFENNRQLYLSYTGKNKGGYGTNIGKAIFKKGSNRLSENKQIFEMKNGGTTGRHFGSRIVVDKSGKLLFTIGDRGTQKRAQDVFDHAGSVLRINKDGTIPKGNLDSTGKTAMPEIWTTGHRNQQGATLHPVTGKLWTVEHGARGGDEINQPQGGKNYGWPVISYGKNYSGSKIGIGQKAEGFEQPVYYWDPSIAPSGLAFYSGKLFKSWQNDLFVGALKDQMLVRLKMDGDKVVDEERLLVDAYGRIRDVRSFADGALWLLTDDTDGKVLRITPAE